MTLDELARLRMLHQQLGFSVIRTAKELVTWLVAVQGQEYSATKWGLGLRLPHLKDSDIEGELTQGALLRTHILRPTWHIIAAEDLRWLLQLSAPRVHAANAYMYRKEGLDPSIFKRSHNILIKSLEGGNYLTREEINAEFLKNNIKAEGHRLSYLMMQAELEGLICSGPRRGNQFTYALLEERVPNAKVKEKDEALAELSKRYYSSRGPATLKDFSTWSGLTITDCKRGLAMVGSSLENVKAEGLDYYFRGVSVQTKKNEHMHLLPIYDELIMGYKDRNAYMLLKQKLKRAVPFRFDSIILQDGQVIGTWKRTIHSKHIDLEYDFFEPLSKTQKDSFSKAVECLADFYQLEVKTKEYR